MVTEALSPLHISPVLDQERLISTTISIAVYQLLLAWELEIIAEELELEDFFGCWIAPCKRLRFFPFE